MALGYDIQDDIKKFLANLGLELLSQIEASDDPITFGHKYASRTYIIFIGIKLDRVTGLVSVNVDMQLQSRKFLIFRKLDSESTATFEVKPMVAETQAVKDLVFNSLAGTSINLQKSILLSKEPLTFSFVEGGIDRQVEAVPLMTKEDQIDWMIFVD